MTEVVESIELTKEEMEKLTDTAISKTKAIVPDYLPSATKKLNRRGVMWLGQTCNLRCHFCYFLDKIEDKTHEEHPFITLEKAKEICRTLVEEYGNNSVDIQGGEPTLYPQIHDLIKYCNEIGLDVTLITNASSLGSKTHVQRYKESGIRDFLVSIQGLGEVYDRIVGRANAHLKQMKGLHHLQEVGIPFRFNVVLSQPALPQLDAIADLAIRSGCKAVNFLAFNPFNDQRLGKRSQENVPSYTEVAKYLNPALDQLDAVGLEVNVRYLPLCILEKRHREKNYNFRQIPYDLHENDFASWSWTDLPDQRIKHRELSPPLQLGKRLRLGSWRTFARKMDKKYPAMGRQMHRVKQALEYAWARNTDGSEREALYQEEAYNRAQEYCGYRYTKSCDGCDVKQICDGFHGDYLDIFGADEARPITVGKKVSDPKHFIQNQIKSIHPHDQEWLEKAPI